MVITETGAAKAVAKALPELLGKLTGNSIRVPTPNVSLAILNLSLENGTTKDEVNDYLREMSLHSDLRKQIDYIDSPEVVSTDFVGSRRAGIVDGLATISNDKNAGALRLVRQRVRLQLPGGPRDGGNGRREPAVVPRQGRSRHPGSRRPARQGRRLRSHA